MTDERDAGGRGGQQQALLLVADNIKRVPATQRSHFENLQLRRLSAPERQPLPVAEQPYAREEQTQHKHQRAKDADDGEAGVGQRGADRREIGGEEGSGGSSSNEQVR